MNECCYVKGKCDHVECWEYHNETGWRDESYPQPTVEDYCASGGHAYAGDDMWDEDTVVGRCYCGYRIYEPGGSS